jgi:hypothetical protein
LLYRLRRADTHNAGAGVREHSLGERDQVVGEPLRVGRVRDVAAVEHDQLGAGDRGGDAPADLQRDDRIVPAPNDERRRCDAGRLSAQVVLGRGKAAPQLADGAQAGSCLVVRTPVSRARRSASVRACM